jgi:hypothetical protein
MAVLIAPARVRFRDPVTGAWLLGVSEPKIDPNHCRLRLTIRAYDPCPFEWSDQRHALARFWRRAQQLNPARPAHLCDVCGTLRVLIAEREGPANLLTNVYAKLVQAGLLGTAQTITDTGSTGRAVTNALNGGIVAASTLLCAGTGATAATVADVNMQTQTESVANPTVNAVSGSGSTGTYTITGTITATADRAYVESGIKVQTTTNSWVFLLAHDSFAALNVSSTGTLSLTYSISNA